LREVIHTCMLRGKARGRNTSVQSGLVCHCRIDGRNRISRPHGGR
jgi:hypothetical protein